MRESVLDGARPGARGVRRDNGRSGDAWRKLARAMAVTASLLMGSGLSYASPGDLDTTFTPMVQNAFGPPKVFDIVPLPNGQVLIGGEFTAIGGQPRMGIARLNADGTLDDSFVVPLDYASIRKIVANPDGTVFIGGNFRWTPQVDSVRELALLSPSGNLARDFDLRSPNFASTSNYIWDILVEPSGTILIGGSFYYLKNINTQGLARLDTFGNLEPLGVSAGLNNDISTGLTVTSLARLSDGRLLVGGTFVATGGRHGLIRTFPDGNVDGTFNSVGTGISQRINALIVQPDDKILVGGSFNSISGQAVTSFARLNADGTLDSNRDPLNTFSMGAPLSMRLQADGKVLLGGILGPIDNTDRYGVARLTSTLGLDSFYPAPGGINGEVWSVETDASGRVLVGGFFTTVAGTPRPTLARLLDTPSSAPQVSNLSLTSSVDEGAVNGAALTGTVSDADAGSAITLNVDWGDGLASVIGPLSSGSNFSVSHTYADDNPTGTTSDLYRVVVTASDGAGGTSTASTSTTVRNLAPIIAAVSFSPSTLVEGGSTSLIGSFSDASALDAFSLVIDWGDGTPNDTQPLPSGATTFSATHTYATAGSYNASLSLTDDDGGSAGGSASIRVTSGPPAPPAALNAVVTTTRVGRTRTYSAALTWLDQSSNETGFVVQRYKLGKKSACLLEAGFSVQVAADATTYTDATATSATCGYQVAATNAQGTSTFVRDLNVGVGVTP